MRRSPLIAAVLLSATLAVPSAAGSSPAKSDPRMLPARKLSCTLGHALNIDPSKNQTVADIRYEGAHAFSLFLPAGQARQVAPDPSDDPEPVDPATRVLADPDGLARDMAPAFVRVVDMWPHRVEMAGRIGQNLSRLIIVSEIDAQKGTANLFMTRAQDAASLDLTQVYQGGCRIETQLR